ncbi:MAG: hypothetical protein LM577_08480, partial [Thermoproteaceae archaeon]|nr:hypothetical protein [Thermoproteaceae archaeon]
MQHPIKAVLPLLAIAVLVLIAVPVMAQEVGAKVKVTVTLGVTDDRYMKYALARNMTDPKAWATMKVGYFTANKTFTLIIRDLKQKDRLSRFWNYSVTFTTNATGYAKFDVDVHTTEVWEAGATRWYVALVLHDWPERGYLWLVYNATISGVTILDVLYCLGGDERGPIISAPSAPYGCVNSRVSDYQAFWTGRVFWGHVSRPAPEVGNYSVIELSAIHLWFLRVPKVAKVDKYEVEIKYTIGTREHTLYKGEHNKTLSERLGKFTFGPFYYVGSLVKEVRGAGEMVKVDRDTVRKLSVVVRSLVLAEGYVAADVINSKNDICEEVGAGAIGPGYCVIENISDVLPWEFVTYDYARGMRVPMEGGVLVTWRVPTVNINVTGLFDLKGNPVLLPEYVTLKAQVKIGERWVEWDVAQVRWRATLKSLRDVIVQVCYSVLDRPVYTIHD